MKELLNLEWSFSNIDNTWTNKTCIISTEIFRVVINLAKTFLQTHHFSSFEIKNKWFSSEKKQHQEEGSCLTLKGVGKLLHRIQKPYQITYIFCKTLLSVSIQPSYTNLLATRGTPGLSVFPEPN